MKLFFAVWNFRNGEQPSVGRTLRFYAENAEIAETMAREMFEKTHAPEDLFSLIVIDFDELKNERIIEGEQ